MGLGTLGIKFIDVVHHSPDLEASITSGFSRGRTEVLSVFIGDYFQYRHKRSNQLSKNEPRTVCHAESNLEYQTKEN